MLRYSPERGQPPKNLYACFNDLQHHRGDTDTVDASNNGGLLLDQFDNCIHFYDRQMLRALLAIIKSAACMSSESNLSTSHQIDAHGKMAYIIATPQSLRESRYSSSLRLLSS